MGRHMEQVAMKLRFAGEARVEHRDTGKKGFPSEGCRASRGPELGRTGHGWDSTLI